MAILTTRSNGQTITAPWFNSIKTLVDNDLVLTPLSVTADKTLGVDANVISADSSGGAIDIDLPALADNDKKYYILKATDLTNDVIVNPDGSDTIDGETEYTFSNIGESIAVVGDATNSNWVIVATAFDSTGGGGGGADIPSTYLVLTPETYNVSTWDTTNLANATLTLNTTAPLKGDSSYELSNITGCVDEYAFYDSIAIPLRSRGKTNSVNFPYICDGDDSDFSIEVYDVTNSATLETMSLETAPSTSKTASLAFYTPLTCEEIQFIIRIDVENNGTSLILDDVVFSDDPFTYVDLYNTSDMVAYTPSIVGVGTPTNVEFFWKRDGDMMDIVGSFASGTATATELQIGLPNSETILSGITSVKVVGVAEFSIASASARRVLATGGDGYLNIGTQSSTTSGLTPANGSAVLASGRILSFSARVPIEGWASETAAVVHSSTGTENTFTANATGSLSASVAITDSTPQVNSADWLTIGYTSTGIFPINYSTLGLTVAPKLTGNALGATGATVQFNNVTTTTADVIVVLAASGAVTDKDFSISLHVGEADYKNPSAYAVTPLTETCYIKDVKATTVSGGSSTGGSYATRDLNTLSGDTGWISLSSNQFTLPPGKYEIRATVPGYAVNRHRAAIYNISDSSIEILGAVIYSVPSGEASNNSIVEGQITLSEPKTFEIQHWTQSTKTTTGFGLASSDGQDEIYTQVKITKLTWG